MDGECHERQFSRRNLRSNARGMSFFASWVGISCQDDKMDSWLGSSKFQDLLKVRSSINPSTWRRCFKTELESDHAVAAIVGDPQCLNSRVIVRMAKHIRIIDEPMDKLDGGKN